MYKSSSSPSERLREKEGGGWRRTIDMFPENPHITSQTGSNVSFLSLCIFSIRPVTS